MESTGNNKKQRTRKATTGTKNRRATASHVISGKPGIGTGIYGADFPNRISANNSSNRKNISGNTTEDRIK